MGPDEIGFLKAAVAFALLAATGLSAFWLRLRAKAMTARDDYVLQSLRDEQARFHADLDARLAELEERLDFTWRRLLQWPITPRLMERPAISTPV